jgi:hypothetical protein
LLIDLTRWPHQEQYLRIHASLLLKHHRSSCATSQHWQLTPLLLCHTDKETSHNINIIHAANQTLSFLEFPEFSINLKRLFVSTFSLQQQTKNPNPQAKLPMESAAASMIQSPIDEKPVVQETPLTATPPRANRGVLHRLIKDQVPVMLAVLAASAGIYRLGLAGLDKMQEAAKPKHDMTMDALEILYEDLLAMRHEMQEIKSSLYGIESMLGDQMMDKMDAIPMARQDGYRMADFEAVFGMTPSNLVVRPPLFNDYLPIGIR